MRFRKTLTFLILATGLAFTLPAWAQQRPVAQGPRFAPCGFSIGHVPPRRCPPEGNKSP